MYLPNFENLRPSSILKVEKSQFNSRVAGVDQFDGQDFNINDCGFIRNDLCQLMRAQSQAEYDMKLKTLTEIPSSSIPDDVTTEDVISMIKPKYAQSPAELAIFAESLAQRDMVKYHDAYEKALKDVKVNDSESSTVESKSD